MPTSGNVIEVVDTSRKEGITFKGSKLQFHPIEKYYSLTPVSAYTALIFIDVQYVQDPRSH